MSTLLLTGCLITGKVVDQNGIGVAGVTVTLSGDLHRTTTTDSNGRYWFGDLLKDDIIPVGNYVVTPSKSGESFFLSNRNVEITTGTLEGYGVVPWPVERMDFMSYPINNLADFKVFAFNDLGMHCYDSDFSVFSILPPFNVVNAQVVRRGYAGSNPEILGNDAVRVRYSAVSDSSGSINTTSINKTDFWMYILPLFGMDLPVDEGLVGAKMPGAGNSPQTFNSYQTETRWFTAAGIPITSWDDNHKPNFYPMMAVWASEVGSSLISPPTFTVLPVSDEMNCGECHATGNVAADAATSTRYGISTWSASLNPDIQYRENILILHDAKNGTALMNSQPALCASCHYSPALDLNGAGPTGSQVGKPMLSLAVHSRHGKTVDKTLPGTIPAVIPDQGITACYYCHPGSNTQCLRGAMGSAGVICQDCHGGLLAVGGEFSLFGGGTRTPWVNEPKCQSCHTGDAVNHLGNEIRLPIAYYPFDQAATPTVSANKRFAEQDGQLYRNSLGHGYMACEACHGSPHAIWPVGDPQANDNIASIQLQGHSGVITECKVCHGDGLSLNNNGPHGLHNVDDRSWNLHHEEFYEQNPASCQPCHGLALGGTVLSRAANNRVLLNENETTIMIEKGTQVSCILCHQNPLNHED